jgi:hypothetical protein
MESLKEKVSKFDKMTAGQMPMTSESQMTVSASKPSKSSMTADFLDVDGYEDIN